MTVGIEVKATIGIRTHAPLAPAPGGHLDDFPSAPSKLAAGLRVVHPIVQSKVQGVFGVLDVSVGGGREIDQFLLLVTDQITILVLTEPKGSRLDDQNAAVDEGDAAAR